jgi:hypothetical protein
MRQRSSATPALAASQSMVACSITIERAERSRRSGFPEEPPVAAEIPVH